MRRLPPLRLLACLALVSCMQADLPTGPPSDTLLPEAPDFEIRDANNNGGNEHFYWVPPTVGGPVNATGIFESAVNAVLEVCEWSGTECLVTVSEFTVADGIIVNLVDEKLGVTDN